MPEPTPDAIRTAIADAISNQVPDQYARLATDAALAVLDDAATERYVRQQLAETGIRSMDFRNGMTMELQPARDLVAAWVAAARTMLGDAENYSETRVDLPKVEMEVKLAGELERYVFVCQRVGKLTPHEARQRAEAERDALADVLNGIDPAKLDLLADWFDQDDARRAGPRGVEVQADLRRWAKQIRGTRPETKEANGD